jgi:hypothetical protein
LEHWYGVVPSTAIWVIAVVEKTEEDYNGWMENFRDEQCLAG